MTCFCETGRHSEHFACFTCRRVVKKTPYHQLPADSRPSTYEQYRPACPECGEPMHNMGKEFRAPRRRDIKAWREAWKRRAQVQRRSMTLGWQACSDPSIAH